MERLNCMSKSSPIGCSLRVRPTWEAQAKATTSSWNMNRLHATAQRWRFVGVLSPRNSSIERT